MSDLTIKWSNNRGSIKIKKFDAQAKRNLQRGLSKLGQFMERELKKVLKGSNPTTFFYKSPYAQLRSRSGLLRASLNAQTSQLSVEVGPGGPPAKYGAVNEYGATITVTEKMRRFLHSQGIHLQASTDEIIIPARPWFWPTWEGKRNEAIALVQRELMKPLG